MLLLPEERYAATYLYEAIDELLVGQYYLAFDHVCYVTLLVNASLDESDTTPGLSAPRYQHDLDLLPVQSLNLLLQMPLYQRHRPYHICLLIAKVAEYVLIPLVLFVHMVTQPLYLVRALQKLLIVEMHGLALQVACQIDVVAEVEALYLQQLAYANKIFLGLFVYSRFLNERYEIDFRNSIGNISTRKPCDR